MQIRPERPEEAAAIAALIAAAFLAAPHADGNEAQIVAKLRQEGGLLLSLVAVEGTALLGHVAASPVTVADAQGWACIAPLCVCPERQRRGIGSALMRAALDQLRAQGMGGVVLVGDPAYYRRFGLVADPAITAPGIPGEYVLSLPMAGTVAGAIRFHPAFGLG